MSTSAIQTLSNPHGTAFSSYAELRDGRLVQVAFPAQDITGEAREAHDALQRHVTNADFPCVGAKASFNGNFYRYGFYDEISSPDATSGLAHDLWYYAKDQSALNTNYATFIASFRGPKVMNEAEWEKRLWQQLQSLHEIDRSDWDETVCSDPGESQFSFSFAGIGFFIVGLHQGASRLSRKFAWPTMVFNVHAQFERLREEGLFERMQSMIRTRDLKLQGSLNPNLSDFGKQSEAKQYSGRPVEKEWKCPFHRVFGRWMKKPHE